MLDYLCLFSSAFLAILQKAGFLHYSDPLVVGGVENVILAHVYLSSEVGDPVTVMAGRGDGAALPPGVRLIHIPELHSQHPQILEMSHELDQALLQAWADAF